MFYLFSLLAGVLIPVTILFNGALAQQHGMHFASVIIHLTGLLAIAAIVTFTRARPFCAAQKWWMYIGGVLGVLTVLSNNIAFARISVSAVMALLLFGQTAAGLVTDQFGWLGTPKHPFNKWRFIGIAFTLAGIIVMMEGTFDALAVIVSFLAGINIVAARTLNGALAEKTNVRVSTFFNYFTGLATSILVFSFFLLTGGSNTYNEAMSFSPDIYMYFGGAAGMFLILIMNYTVTKVPAFYLSLLMFIGQVFAGLLIDTIKDGRFSVRILAGGILVTLGLCSDLYLAKTKAPGKNTKTP